MKLKLGIPKGSLQDVDGPALRPRRLQHLRQHAARTFPAIDDPEIECMLIRAQEMARYVSDGVLDAALTGLDWIGEQRSRPMTPGPSCRWPISSTRNRASARCGGFWRRPRIRCSCVPKDLEGCTVATELVRVTEAYFATLGVRANVEFSWGATEVKPPVLADAIVEATETGSTLRANRLRILDTVLESNTQLIANPATLGGSRGSGRNSRTSRSCSQAAIEAQGRVGLMLNVRKDDLETLLELVPALPPSDGVVVERRLNGSRSTPSSRSGRSAI